MPNHNLIRNFCIIAHIDHGKSTLADRMLELTGTIAKDKIKPQMLDSNPIERERGITIKLQPVRMEYQTKITNGKLQITNKSQIQNSKQIADLKQGLVLNLIDTPGHVDFSYEVSRSLAAVETAILLVDASQGIQAQTLANYRQAKALGLYIIPVVNKIDLPHAEPEKTAQELAKLIQVSEDEIIFASGKSGDGVEEILERLATKAPAPQGDIDQPFRGLIFDSIFDRHRGVIVFVRIVDGAIATKDKIFLLGTQTSDQALEVGVFNPAQQPKEKLEAGEIGYIVTGLKNIRQVRVGDTVTKIPNSKLQITKQEDHPEALPGYRQPEPMVYASIYPASADDYPALRDAIDKYILNDGSLTVEPESSSVLGFGFRLGFLGLLHVEIVSERLHREYNLELITTTPQVEYEILMTSGETICIRSISDLPDQSKIKEIKEPWVKAEIITPSIYLGQIMELIQSSRGVYDETDYIDTENVIISSTLPLAEIITDFYDNLKSVSSGYASMTYQPCGYNIGDLIKLDIILADSPVPALSGLVPQVKLEKIAKQKVAKLKTIVPKTMFEIKIQAAVGGRVIASERISAMRKDVTAKLYGGDVTRKNKLLEKQSKGKKRMRQFGRVSLPHNIFIELLKK